uniref:Uncharacterized protein n=1 Tax=Ciona savignyi TaxID=51511 RepID=H2YGX9_CIOSA
MKELNTLVARWSSVINGWQINGYLPPSKYLPSSAILKERLWITVYYKAIITTKKFLGRDTVVKSISVISFIRLLIDCLVLCNFFVEHCF